MARNYYEDEREIDPYDPNRDELIAELEGGAAADPFADVSAPDRFGEDGSGGYTGEGIPAIQSPEDAGAIAEDVSGSASAGSPYSYGGPWSGWGDPTGRDTTNSKYFFQKTAQGYDPNRLATDDAYRQELLNALNGNQFGGQYYLSEENDFMATQPGEDYDGAYMGVRDRDGDGQYEYQWMTSAGNPIAQGRDIANDPTLGKDAAYDLGMSGSGAVANQSSSAPGASSVGNGTPAANPTVTPGANAGGVDASVRAYLTKILGMDPYAVDVNDPAIMASQTAYERAQERALNKNRGAMAERMNASGTMGGGLDTWVSNAYQNMGEANAGNQANLVLKQQENQLAQLENALKVGAGVLTADQESALRMKIAEMQNALGNRQIDYSYYNTNTTKDYNQDYLNFLVNKWIQDQNTGAVNFDW